MTGIVEDRLDKRVASYGVAFPITGILWSPSSFLSAESGECAADFVATLFQHINDRYNRRSGVDVRLDFEDTINVLDGRASVEAAE